MSTLTAHRVNSVETPEELQDVYGHFLLYYGRDLAKMHNRTAAGNGEEMEERSGVSENIKHASRQDGYSLCVQAGLGKTNPTGNTVFTSVSAANQIDLLVVENQRLNFDIKYEY